MDTPRIDGEACIVTERLILRSFRDADDEPFAALNADPVVMEHLPSVLTRVESDAMADRIQSGIAQRGFGYWAVELRAERRLIGFCGLSVPSFVPPFPHADPFVDIGWRLARDAWGFGYATEAAHAALAFGWSTLKLREILSFTVPANRPSRKVMDRIGMKHHPESDFDHPVFAEGHRLRRHVLYRITRPEDARKIG